MAKNFQQPADVIDFAHTAAVESGELVTIGTKVAVALGAFEENEQGAYSLDGAWLVPKAEATGALSVGDAVYASGGEITTETNDTYAGIAVESAGAEADLCVVRLNF